MNQSERKRLDELCSSISHEEDAAKFSELVAELDQLLGEKEEALRVQEERK